MVAKRLAVAARAAPQGRTVITPLTQALVSRWNCDVAHVADARTEAAKTAVIARQPYSGLSDTLYDKPIVIMFDAVTVCRNNR